MDSWRGNSIRGKSPALLLPPLRRITHFPQRHSNPTRRVVVERDHIGALGLYPHSNNPLPRPRHKILVVQVAYLVKDSRPDGCGPLTPIRCISSLLCHVSNLLTTAIMTALQKSSLKFFSVPGILVADIRKAPLSPRNPILCSRTHRGLATLTVYQPQDQVCLALRTFQ